MRFHYLVAATAFGAIALVACGSGGSYGSSSVATVATPRTVAVKTRSTALGKVLVDAKGLTLYGLTQDGNGTPTCVAACANVWPPLIVDGTNLPSQLDARTFSVVARPDGSHQLEAGKWPLYRFVGDAAPGDVNGQGSAGMFFVVTPTGMLRKG